MPNFVTKVFNKAAEFKPIKAMIDDFSVMDNGEKATYLAAGATKVAAAATLPLLEKISQQTDDLTGMFAIAAFTYIGFAYLQAVVRSDEHNGKPIVVKPQKFLENLTVRVI